MSPKKTQIHNSTKSGKKHTNKKKLNRAIVIIKKHQTHSEAKEYNKQNEKKKKNSTGCINTTLDQAE